MSIDIGGTDPDDFQSLVHLLVTADSFDLEGLVSSPFGLGRRKHIAQVIDLYADDFPNLRSWSALYPTPDRLHAIAKQGATEVAGFRGIGATTEGSDWIVRCARRSDPRPLHLLVWGGIEDLAQALHDAPDILPKLQVYFIGGPNKKWSPNAYAYIAGNPRLPGWGGNYARAWSRAPYGFARLTTAADEVEVFSTVELALPIPAVSRADAVMHFDNLRLPGYRDGPVMRFRCSPKEAKRYDYRIESPDPAMAATGGFTALSLSSARATPDPRWPNWWTDDPAPALAEGPHAGARTVNRWRHQFLGEFAERMGRCAAPFPYSTSRP